MEHLYSSGNKKRNKYKVKKIMESEEGKAGECTATKVRWQLEEERELGRGER